MGVFRRGYRTSEYGHVDEKLSAYLDGQLSPAERNAVAIHLETCGRCQWDLDTLRTTVQWTRELPAVPVPRAFTIAVQAGPAREPRWRWTLPVLQGATAVVALLFVFSVAGDLMLRRVLPASTPYPPRGELVLQEVPAAEEAAEVVIEAEAPPLVEVTVLAELPVSDETSAPVMEAVPEAESMPEGEAPKAMATEAASARASGATAMEVPVEEVEVGVTQEKEATSDAVPAEPPPMPAAEAVEPATAPLVLTPTLAPTMPPPTAEPTLRPPPAEPTVIVQAPAPAPPVGYGEARPTEYWLGVAEVVFGVTFVLLATLTIAFTLRRLRTR